MVNIKRYDLSPEVYLYYHHVPKTGGHTLHSVLEKFFTTEEVCPARLWKHLIAIPREQLLRYRLFSGHFYYYISQLLPRDPISITMLRDPVKRSLSHYHHIRRERFLYHHEYALSGDILSFVTNPVTRPQIENFQTKLIALNLEPSVVEKHWGETTFNQYKLHHFDHWLELPTRLTSEALLDRAKTRLEQFAFVGLTEHFSESLVLLSYILNRRVELEVERKNVDPEQHSNEELASVALEAIQEATQLDASLYTYAQELFQNRLQKIALELHLQVLELQHETVTLRTRLEQLEPKPVIHNAASNNQLLKQTLNTVRVSFQHYDLMRNHPDRFLNLNRLQLIAFPIKVLFRIVFMGKVWAAERQLLHAIIDTLHQVSEVSDNFDKSEEEKQNI